MRLLLHKFRPEILVIREQLERRGQAEVVAVIIQEFEAEGVDGAEPRAVKSGENFRGGTAAQEFFARALLHLIRRAISEGENDETRQRGERIGRLRELHDAICDRASFAGTSCRDDGEIALQFRRKTKTLGVIVRRIHRE